MNPREYEQSNQRYTNENLKKVKSKKSILEKKQIIKTNNEDLLKNCKASITDLLTSDDYTNQSSMDKTQCIKTLQLKVIDLTNENRLLKKQLMKYKQQGFLKTCNEKLQNLVNEIDDLANQNQLIRQQLEQALVEKDFYLRAYKNIKKDNQCLFKQLNSKRKQCESLKEDRKSKESQSNQKNPETLPTRTRTNSQNSLKNYYQNQPIQDIVMMIGDLRNEVQKIPSLKSLEEVLKKVQRKISLQKKLFSREKQVNRKEYFPDYKSKQKLVRKP